MTTGGVFVCVERKRERERERESDIHCSVTSVQYVLTIAEITECMERAPGLPAANHDYVSTVRANSAMRSALGRVCGRWATDATEGNPTCGRMGLRVVRGPPDDTRVDNRAVDSDS